MDCRVLIGEVSTSTNARTGTILGGVARLGTNVGDPQGCKTIRNQRTLDEVTRIL